MTWYVYALAVPTTGAIRYVGKSKNPAQRLFSHISAAAAAPVRAWVDSLGCSPHLKILDEAANETDALLLEQKWIGNLIAAGSVLLNSRRAVDGPRKGRQVRFEGMGRRALARRKELGLSQGDVCQAVGIDRTRLSRLEHGERPHITAESAVLFARALDVSVEWLVTGEERAKKASAA